MHDFKISSSRLTRHRALWFLLLLALLLAGCSFQQDRDRTDEERVSELRGLKPLKPVTRAFQTSDELRQRIVDEWFKDYSEQDIRDDVLLYVAFEFAESDLDLYNLLVDMLTEQIAGYYDFDTEELYVINSNKEPGVLERYSFSHEYTHALQDQHFDVGGLIETYKDTDSERTIAIRSLVEGDATLLQQQFVFQYFGRNDVGDLLDQLENVDSSAIDAVPAVVRESFMFQYLAGFTFVTTLFSDGGWAAVDAAYADPPLSTEQILHPERYPDDVPQVVALPPLTDTLGAGWHLVDEDVLGEFGLQLYLEVRLDPEVVERAAEGWGGDHYAVHWRDDESGFVLVVRLAWDTTADAAEFHQAYQRFAEDRFGGGPARSDGNARLWWFGDDALLLAQNSRDETLILIAPDETTLDQVYARFPDF